MDPPVSGSRRGVGTSGPAFAERHSRKPDADERRMILGILHGLRAWAEIRLPLGRCSGGIRPPSKTLSHRFVRWAGKAVWRELFEALAAAGGPPATACRLA